VVDKVFSVVFITLLCVGCLPGVAMQLKHVLLISGCYGVLIVDKRLLRCSE